MKDLKISLEFLSGDYDRVQSELKTYEGKINSVMKEKANLTDTVRDIPSRFSLMEQHVRENNLEINSIPENKSENLVTIVKQLTFCLYRNESDIIMSTRVRILDQNSKKPRSIIVKLLGTKLRDNVLAAVSKLNKANPIEKLHTGHLVDYLVSCFLIRPFVTLPEKYTCTIKTKSPRKRFFNTFGFVMVAYLFARMKTHPPNR